MNPINVQKFESFNPKQINQETNKLIEKEPLLLKSPQIYTLKNVNLIRECIKYAINNFLYYYKNYLDIQLHLLYLNSHNIQIINFRNASCYLFKCIKNILFGSLFIEHYTEEINQRIKFIDLQIEKYSKFQIDNFTLSELRELFMLEEIKECNYFWSKIFWDFLHYSSIGIYFTKNIENIEDSKNDFYCFLLYFYTMLPCSFCLKNYLNKPIPQLLKNTDPITAVYNLHNYVNSNRYGLAPIFFYMKEFEEKYNIIVN